MAVPFDIVHAAMHVRTSWVSKYRAVAQCSRPCLRSTLRQTQRVLQLAMRTLALCPIFCHIPSFFVITHLPPAYNLAIEQSC